MPPPDCYERASSLMNAEIYVGIQGASEFIITDVKGHATLGTTLAFLNVFRSNLSYGRYWDGRGQLGFLVRSGRELMRTIVTYTRIPETKEEDNELAEQAKEVLRLTNCLHHSIVLAIQNYDDHPPFDPPYDIKEKLVTHPWYRMAAKNTRWSVALSPQKNLPILLFAKIREHSNLWTKPELPIR